MVTATIRNPSINIGADAFDLTKESSSNPNQRGLTIVADNNSNGQRFANAEKFSFSKLSRDPVNVNDPTSGASASYYIKVTFVVDATGNLTKNYTYLKNSDNTAGISVVCRAKNGTDTDTNNDIVKSWDIKTQMKTTNTYTVDATANGFPYKIYGFLNDDIYIGSACKMHISKLEVGSDAEHLYTVWTGKIAVGSKVNGFGNELDWEGNTTFHYTASESDNYITSSQTWKNASGNYHKTPFASAIFASYSNDEIEMNKNTSNYTAIADCKAMDQYGVKLDQSLCSLTNASSVSSKTSHFNAANNKSIPTSSSNANYNKAVTSFTLSGAHLSGVGNNYQTVTSTFTWTDANSSKTAKASFSVTDEKYAVTYKDYETNTVIDVLNFYYGDIPEREVPFKVDDDYHYLDGYWDLNSEPIYKDETANAIYSKGEHYYILVPEESKEPTCTQPAWEVYECQNCGYNKNVPNSPALGHTGDTTPHTTSVKDGSPAITYFQCTRCNTCWGAQYSGGSYVKDPENEQAPTETGEPDISAVEANTATNNMLSPAPTFNNVVVNYSGGTYDYSTRCASLRIDYTNTFDSTNGTNGYNNTQDLRFSGALTVPSNVSYMVDTQSDNVVTDFGFVYTQYRYISSPNKLVIGGMTDKTEIDGKTYPISKMSVKAKNSSRGYYTGSNWKGVTARTVNGQTQLIFNLVIAIKAKNWNYLYCARPYITYKFRGVEYTIYDEGAVAVGNKFSCNSVAYVANQVVADDTVHIIERNYFQNKVIDHLSALPGYEG